MALLAHPIIEEYLKSIVTSTTRKEYRHRLIQFERFCEELGGIEEVVNKLKDKTLNAYLLVHNFYLSEVEKGINLSTAKERIATVTNFVELGADIDLNRHKLKKKIHYARVPKRQKFAPSRDLILKILTNCSNPRLKAYLHFLAATGARATESLSLKVKNLDLKSDPPRVHFPASITKTRQERDTYLTRELVEQLRIWLQHKYRTRNKVDRNYMDGKSKTKTKTYSYTPESNEDDLLFSVRNNEGNPSNMYTGIIFYFTELLKSLHLDQRYDDGRHKMTLHRFRDFVKSTISNQGYGDFSEFMIGHVHSTYFSAPEDEKAKVFAKIEPSLTYLDKDVVGVMTKDLQSQISVEESEIKELRERLSKMEQQMTNISSTGSPIPVLIV